MGRLIILAFKPTSLVQNKKKREFLYQVASTLTPGILWGISSYLLLNQPHWYKTKKKREFLYQVASTLRTFTLHRCHQLQPSARVDFQIGILEFILVDLLNLSTLPETNSSHQKMDGWKTNLIHPHPKNKAFFESLLTQMVGSLW